MIMLDTDVCIQMLRGNGENLFKRLSAETRPCAISAIVLGELAVGAEKSLDPASGWQAVTLFCGSLTVMSFDLNAAIEFGKIRAALETAGIVVGPYDMQIAAHAISSGAVLVTKNLRHFSRINGLTIEDWPA